MGANRRLPSPEHYPAAFHAVLKQGGGILYPENLPWTLGSTAKRFRLFLASIKDRREHPLKGLACARWSVRTEGGALHIFRADALTKAGRRHAVLLPAVEAALLNRDKP